MQKESEKAKSKYVDEEDEKRASETKRMAYFLRGRRGMPVRQGIELGKRVEYFKGDKLASFLLKNKSKCKNLWPSELLDKPDVLPIGQALLRMGYIHASDRSKERKKVLHPSDVQAFTLDGYYTWIYEGSKVLRNVLSALLIIGFFIATCFPIWPYWAKISLWYFSVTMLITMLSFTLVRAVVFFGLWLIGMECWIFPNLFDESLSVVDSFKPAYSFAQTSPGDRIYRLGGVILSGFFAYWIYSQPANFDDYMNVTKQFTEDIYSGKLLADIAETQNSKAAKPFNVPNYQDFVKEDEETEEENPQEEPEGESTQEEEEEPRLMDESEKVEEEQRQQKDEM